MSTFSSLVMSLAGPVVKKALQALGIGVVSYGAVLVAFNAAQAQILALYGQAPASMLWFIERAGVATGMGIVLGALAAKFGLQAIGKLGRIGQ